MTEPINISLSQARRFWHRRQGLAVPPDGAVDETIAETGWARTLGGIDVYLALLARRVTLTRAELDEAVRHGTLHVVPAVRGCIYLVPTRDVATVMALAADLSRPRTSRDLEKVGSSWNEVETVAAAVTEVLADGPLQTTAIRKKLPAGSLRSFGDAGKRVGLSSPLPVALRHLEFQGRIRRAPVGQRLDTEKYDWQLSGERADWQAEQDRSPADRMALICSRFLDFFAPATAKEIADWVGVPQRDVKVSLAQLDVVAVSIEERAGNFLIPAKYGDELTSFPECNDFRFLSFEDNLLTVHGGPGVLTDSRFHELPVATWGGRGKSAPLGSLKHLGQRALLRGDELVGFWEFDPDQESVATATFRPLAGRERRILEDEAAQLALFLRDELGHGRSFSLDTDDALRQRVATVRAMT